MSKFYDDEFYGRFYGRGTECQFEPNVALILCFECGKPTNETGTCTDSGLCPKCRTEYEELIGKEDVAELMVGVSSGEHYYKSIQRKLHYGPHGDPICRKFSNQQPVTSQVDNVTCSRCIHYLAMERS